MMPYGAALWPSKSLPRGGGETGGAGEEAAQRVAEILQDGALDPNLDRLDRLAAPRAVDQHEALKQLGGFVGRAELPHPEQLPLRRFRHHFLPPAATIQGIPK